MRSQSYGCLNEALSSRRKPNLKARSARNLSGPFIFGHCPFGSHPDGEETALRSVITRGASVHDQPTRERRSAGIVSSVGATCRDSHAPNGARMVRVARQQEGRPEVRYRRTTATRLRRMTGGTQSYALGSKKRRKRPILFPCGKQGKLSLSPRKEGASEEGEEWEERAKRWKGSLKRDLTITPFAAFYQRELLSTATLTFDWRMPEGLHGNVSRLLVASPIGCLAWLRRERLCDRCIKRTVGNAIERCKSSQTDHSFSGRGRMVAHAKGTCLGSKTTLVRFQPPRLNGAERS